MSALFRQTAVSVSRSSRSFATSAIARKDLVQELYLKELKSYKPAPAAKDAHVGAVKNFSAPAAPKPPAVPSDIASDLSAYDASEPSKASHGVTHTEGVEHGAGAEAFLTFLEADIPKHEAHH